MSVVVQQTKLLWVRLQLHDGSGKQLTINPVFMTQTFQAFLRVVLLLLDSHLGSFTASLNADYAFCCFNYYKLSQNHSIFCLFCKDSQPENSHLPQQNYKMKHKIGRYFIFYVLSQVPCTELVFPKVLFFCPFFFTPL